MGSTKIISTLTEPTFKVDSRLSLNTLDISAQDSSTLSRSNSDRSCLYIKNCDIDNSIDPSIGKSNILVIKTSSLNVNKEFNIDNVNNVNIYNSSININTDYKYSIFPNDNIVKIESSDVYLLDITFNISLLNVIDFDGCEINNSYVKNIDINYKIFYDNYVYDNIILMDTATITIL